MPRIMRFEGRELRILLILDVVLTVVFVLAVTVFDVAVRAAVVNYLIVCFALFVVFIAIRFAQSRGLVPRGVPIRPMRPAAEAAGTSDFLFGARDAAAEAAAKDRVIEDYLETARSLIQSERFEECADLLQKALESDAGNSRLLNSLGICLGRLMRYEEAIRAYQGSIESDYDNAGAHFNLAVAFEHAERIPEAVGQYRRYLKIAEVLGEPEDMMERARDRLRFLRSPMERE
ncbi:MAG: tetratricopeptide repeat protein [Deltaproteobacteria bacterium]|nr:tetratricopeptide repeat protein [Deltaproteobacteria bacterium]